MDSMDSDNNEVDNNYGYLMGSRRRTECLPGGLYIEFPLSDWPLNAIFEKIIDANFDVDLIEEESREGARHIIGGLSEVPLTLTNYITKQRIYTCLTWAADKRQIESSCCDSFAVQRVEENSTVYVIQLTPGFCEHNEIRTSSLLSLEANGYRVYGRVTDFDETTCLLKFTPFRRKLSESVIYRISFIPSPFIYRSRYRTLNWLHSLELENLIFPKDTSSCLPLADYIRAENDILPRLKFSKSFNSQQKKAIFSILSGHHGCLPFLLYGPPGTGKTITLVETVRLLLADKNRDAKILVCTPSNTAADLFALQLLNKANIQPSKVFRMYSLMHDVLSQNQELRDVMCICADKDGSHLFGIYEEPEILKRQVVVSTIIASTYLISGGLNGKFTHIFIDEAGQAAEVDTLIPLIGLATVDTKVVLAGDPKQLGPVESLDYVNRQGLSNSLLERFISLPCYRNDRRLICMLEENYRSHPAIIKIPSELFYNSRLFASTAFQQKDKLSHWDKLPKKGFPIIWHHVEAKEVMESEGHSYCNEAEIQVVVNYVKMVISKLDVKPEDIGIITPYKYQVRMLRHALTNVAGLTIDSVERFQGSERRVIIVSLVRNEKIGFLSDDKRFNTTIMRAEELLIFVGNSSTLSWNQSWHKFVEYCSENGVIINKKSQTHTVEINLNHIIKNEQA